MRYINDDIKLKNGGRKAPSISGEELYEKMLQFAVKYDDSFDPDDPDYRALHALASGILFTEKVEKDLKIMNMPENFAVDQSDNFMQNIGEPLLGLQSLPNGLTFCGITGGADWGLPMFYAIYWDGAKIRVYIPAKGNLVNMDTKTAFGLEGETDTDLDAVLLKYAAAGIRTGTGESDMTGLYLQKYGLDRSTLAFNWDAIREDITARIVVTDGK